MGRRGEFSPGTKILSHKRAHPIAEEGLPRRREDEAIKIPAARYRKSRVT